MYKAQLQELCHRRRWGLPKYCYMKDGPDHSPSFKASVSVNGESFDSSPSCNSSKEALNDAARLALLRFNSPIRASPDDLSISNAELSSAGGGLKKEEESRSPIIQVMDDLHCQYKTRLQNYARFENLVLPLYSSKSEGPSHKPAFKATVTVGGNTFESPAFFKTVKEAEHAAAKAALMSLYRDGIQVVDAGFYKSLLQELTQRENLSIPIYKTKRSGTPHMPAFVSSVEVKGQLFHGKEGKSKKEAEAKAAEAAYTILKERSLCLSSRLASPDPGITQPIKWAPSSESPAIVDSQHIINDKVLAASLSILNDEKHDEQSKDKVQEVCSAEIAPAKAIGSFSDSTPSPKTRCKVKLNENQGSPRPQPLLQAPTEAVPPTNPDISALSISDSNTETTTRARSYLLGNKVRVYPCFPNIAFPKGITVLPISDTQWIPVSLEYPRENAT